MIGRLLKGGGVAVVFPRELNDKRLDEYIADLKRARALSHDVDSVNEFTESLDSAAAEKTNRATTRFSKIAIGISTLSLIVATIGIKELVIIFWEATLSLIVATIGIWQ